MRPFFVAVALLTLTLNSAKAADIVAPSSDTFGPGLPLDTIFNTNPRQYQQYIGRDLFPQTALPQLINVFKGEMSLVGPRPEVRWCVDLYTDEEREILTVRPGITDWSSIKFNNEGEIVARSGYADANQAYLDLIRPEKLRLQLRYVHERSLAVDLKILWQTIATLSKTRGPMLRDAL